MPYQLSVRFPSAVIVAMVMEAAVVASNTHSPMYMDWSRMQLEGKGEK